MLKKSLFLLFVLLLMLPVIEAVDDQYKPYIHKANVPSSPKPKLYGKYTTNLFPGAATYSYPIEVPKGTNNLQPTITLSYNSQSVKQRPSILGAGWSLTQSYILRDVNFTTYNTTDDEFNLILNGNSYNLKYDTSDLFYHTENEIFAKIQNLSNAGNTYWLATLKDGTLLRFGYKSDSELTSNSGFSYALKWNLDLIEDTHGNKIHYNYSEDPYPEDNGTSYISKITYNNEQLRKIEFDYENEPRADRRLVYEQGNKLDESRRLSNIYIYFNNTLVRRYNFEYISLNNQSSLSSLFKIKYIGSDNLSIPHTITFGYYEPASIYYNSSTHSNLSTLFSDDVGRDLGVRLLDINNDGFIDIIKGRQSTSEKKTFLNNRTGWNETNVFTLPDYFVDGSHLDKGMRIADINNDGFPDLMQGWGGVRKAWLNNGTNWSESLAWAPPIDFVIVDVDRGVEIVDINGDGKVDLLQATEEAQAKHAYLNTGNGWKNVNTTWISPIYFIKSDGSDYGARLVDLNNDDLTDIIQGYSFNTEIKAAWLNNGSGWVNFSLIWAPKKVFTSTSTVDLGTRFMDVDGDGLTDIVESYKNGSLEGKTTWLNNGSGWSNSSIWHSPEPFTNDGKNLGRRIGDVNGDGFGDVIVSYNNAVEDIKRVVIRNTTVPFLLRNITNEFGGITYVEYATSTSFNNTGEDGISDIGFNIWVVKEVIQNNSLTGDFGISSNTSYSYAYGFYDYNDSEFRGFNLVNETLSDKSAITHYFNQNKELKGKEYKTQIHDKNGNIFSKTENNFNFTKANFTFIVNLLNTVSYLYDGDNSSVRVTNVSYRYDNYSNIINKIQYGNGFADGDEKYENYSYAINTSSWILDRIIWYVLFDSSHNKARESKYFYDDEEYGSVNSKGELTKQESWLNTGGGSPTTRYRYDDFGNLIEQTDALGRITKYEYGLNDLTSTYLERITNALGHAVTYTYDFGTGNILTETKNGITKTFEYDTFSRIIKEIQPYDDSDLPTKQYIYLFDNTAPETITTKQKTTSNKTIDIHYYYDGFANLVQIKTPSDDNNQQVVKNIFYDGLYRIKEEQNPFFDTSNINLTITTNQSNKTKYNYDALNRITSIINPDGTTKNTTYTKWEINDYDENSNRHTYLLDAYDRIISVTEYNTDFYLLDNETYNTTYNYDVSDNLIGIRDTYGNHFNFTYDSLGRKIRLNDPDLGTWTYSYDLVGNLISQTGGGGNLITGDSFYREYNGLGQLKSVKEGNTSSGRFLEEYFYDSNGDRIKVTRYCYSSDCTNETIYTPYKEWMQIRNSSGTFNFYYIYQDGVLVSRLNPDGSKWFYHSDHLGSTTLITDQNGNVVENEFYSPFGESLTANEDEEFRLYTSQFKDSIDCQYYYGARYYAPCNAIFIQPDHFISYYLPQSLNRYSYGLNNPYKYLDDSGNNPIVTGFFGAIISGGLSLGKQLWDNNGDFSKVDWGDVGKDAGAGFVAGATFGVGTSVAGSGFIATLGSGAASGVAYGQTEQVIENVEEGKHITEGLFEAEDVLSDAAGGAIGAGVGYAVGRGINALSSSGSKVAMTPKQIGAVGERQLAQEVGGQSQNYFSTPTGGRYHDQFSRKIGYEAKTGYTTYNNQVRTQIQKDAYLIQSGKVQGVQWRFYRSPVTGKIGASKGVIAALKTANIGYQNAG